LGPGFEVPAITPALKVLNMPQVKSITVYTFDELSDNAKDRAIDSLRYNQVEDQWWDCTYGDAKEIGLQITSFDLDRNRHAKGRFIISAEFCANAIVASHGETCETYRTAAAYIADLKDLNTTLSKAEHDLENNPNDVEADETADKASEDIEDLASEFLQSILEDYSIMLQRECEYLQSDEAIIETIKCNDWTFTASGKMENI
jgi:hypothetical protein